jgi:hypothetical protein
MDGADLSKTATREPSIRRQLAELTDRQGWVHHVVDVDTGEVLTTPLDRPLAPLSRAERLARLGHGIPLPSPWGPVYKLTARSPYQTAPLNWLSVYDPIISRPTLRITSIGRFLRTSSPARTCRGCAPILTSRRHSAASSRLSSRQLLGRSGRAHPHSGIGQRSDPDRWQLRRTHRGSLVRPIPLAVRLRSSSPSSRASTRWCSTRSPFKRNE